MVAFYLNTIPELMTGFGEEPSRQFINLHLAFNLVLAVLALPFALPITNLIARFVTEHTKNDVSLEIKGALDLTALGRPTKGLNCVACELSGMGQRIEQMLRAVDTLYDNWDAANAK